MKQEKCIFVAGLVLGVLFGAGFFLLSLLVLPAVAPNEFDALIKDWKGLFSDD